MTAAATTTEKHKAAPHSWQDDPETPGALMRPRGCAYCGKPIQRRGLLRRWRHVA